MSRSGRLSRPQTGRPRTANTPRGLLSTVGGGDNVPIDLDEELQTVLRKEYDDGENGKIEAIHDVKSVLHQVAQDPMAQQMDKLIPRFLAPLKSGGSAFEDTASARAQTSRSKSKPRATPRHAKLTARPSTVGGKSGQKFTDERHSVPNIPHENTNHNGTMRIITSAPSIPAESRYSTTASSVPAPSSSSSSKRMSRSSKTVESTTTEGIQHRHESALSTTPTTGIVERSMAQNDRTESPEGGLPFTENLLEVTSDSEEAEEIWKSDIVEHTRIKSTPKGKSYSGPDSLELKYKDPIWPHQLFLNQILARLPSLTHFVLDGSELRFLRDLGSSLQSLITLSICECGLRSLDGIYGMPNLRTLIARKNMISIPTQLSFLRKLSYVDLSSNPICSADKFGSLRHCGELRILKLYDTPLAVNQSNFNKEIKRLVLQLKEIHPSRLYDLIGMPRLMVRSSQIASTDIEGNHHQNPGQNQQQMWQESKQVGAAILGGGETNNKKEKSRRNDPSMMPSLAYDDVMVDQQPKPGIAYQKIETNKTLKEQEQEHRQKQSEIKDVSLGTGDFTGIFMAPKFLQHLEETMPPSTAEDDDEDDEKQQQQQEQDSHHHHYPHESFGAAANSHQDEILLNQEGSEILGTGGKILRKKSDRGLLQQRDNQQQQRSSKNHPRGDGDPGYN